MCRPSGEYCINGWPPNHGPECVFYSFAEAEFKYSLVAHSAVMLRANIRIGCNTVDCELVLYSGCDCVTY